MKRALTLLVVLLVGCGGAAKPAASEPSEKAALEPGLKCLDEANLPRAAAKDAPPRMDLAHIIVRYAGLRGAGTITRTREEACLRAQEVRKQLLAGGDWDTLRGSYSDSKDATNGEFHGTAQEDLEKRFGDTAFALKVDELSQVIETENGFHVIWRMK